MLYQVDYISYNYKKNETLYVEANDIIEMGEILRDEKVICFYLDNILNVKVLDNYIHRKEG